MFGVYVHIPFCAAKCDYCAFATWTDRAHLIDAYVDALVAEIAVASAAGLPVADTVFVGGGTPTLLDPARLVRVLDAISRTADAEVTVECNPDDVTEPLLAVYRAGGVNRVSIGVQSTSAHVLAALGRTHDPDSIGHAVEAVRAVAMPSFNLDIIYGAAGESLDDWRRTVADVVALGPPHVSAYGLTVEPGTPLAGEPARHPDDDDQADKYEIADDLLVAAGMDNYEVSNWARQGHESRHNRLYWREGDYRGFGCAAHSHRQGRRWWNVRTPERYIDLIASGHSAESAAEQLDPEQRRIEGLQLALRTRDGVPRTAFDEATLELLDDLVVGHPADAQRVVLTRRGRLMANEVSVRLR
jgi:oxygen-independent coproporphyrinogen-3 oxidase